MARWSDRSSHLAVDAQGIYVALPDAAGQHMLLQFHQTHSLIRGKQLVIATPDRVPHSQYGVRATNPGVPQFLIGRGQKKPRVLDGEIQAMFARG